MDARSRAGAKQLLGEILLERGLVTKEQLDQALRLQVGGMRRLGSILVKMKLIGVDDLTGALSAQLKLPVVKIADEFRETARAVLPRHLCRKYSVLPLSLESNNVLRLAMADPLDGHAIADVENFTGYVVQPVLTKLDDLERSIPVCTRMSRHDFFNPEVYRWAARVATAAAVVLLLTTGFLVYKQVLVQMHGTEVHRPDGSVVYQHRDLTLDVAKNGSIDFAGRGMFANGYFGVRFENVGQLTTFVNGVKGQLSDEQQKWLQWAFKNKLHAPETLLAAKSP